MGLGRDFAELQNVRSRLFARAKGREALAAAATEMSQRRQVSEVPSTEHEPSQPSQADCPAHSELTLRAGGSQLQFLQMLEGNKNPKVTHSEQ